MLRSSWAGDELDGEHVSVATVPPIARATAPVSMASNPITVVTRVRPVSVRFTDASIQDLDAELRGKPTILDNDNLADDGVDRAGAALGQRSSTLFDAHLEEEEGQPRSMGVEDEEELLQHLAEEEDIVRIFKQKIRAARPSLAHRRLRLIHAGRILKDGIKLVSWLDSLDSHRSAQERAANRSTGLIIGEGARAALGGLREAAERGAALDLDSLTRRGRQGLGDLWRRFEDDERKEGRTDDVEAAAGGERSAKAKGKARLIDDDEERASGPGWESAEAAPPRRAGVKVVEDRSADRVYIQCSIGDNMTPEEEAEANAPRASVISSGLKGRLNPWAPSSSPGTAQYSSPATGQSDPAIPAEHSPWADIDDDPFSDPTSSWSNANRSQAGPLSSEADDGTAVRDPDSNEITDAPRGFDRLAATAGLSATEIEEMRSQFRQAAARGWGDGVGQGAAGPSGLGRSGDVLREAEEEEHARALEEQWIDSMGEGIEGDANRTGSGLLQARFEGLFVGFFFPFLPLFFWRDKSGHPARLPRSEFVYDPQRPGEVIRANEIDYDSEDDDDVIGANARPGPGGTNPAIANQEARNVVFTPTMAQAIVVGLVCNVAYGALASLC
ncbi:unnamed protein product [Tilletia controversa]|nr:unnamed protein product [Tilletia controversa]